MTEINQIEAQTKRYAEIREQLGTCVATLNDGIEQLKRAQMPEIKRLVKRLAEQHDKLQQMVAGSPELFEKKRTLIIHGIKVGIVKGKGTIEIENTERTIALIEKQLPELAETLIAVKKSPVKTALAQLSVADLKKIGVKVIETGDEVVIKATDSDVDKLVARLVAGAVNESEAA